MPWVEFTSDFSFRLTPAVTTSYKAGWRGNVTTRCASAAITAGKAERLPTSRREEVPNAAEE